MSEPAQSIGLDEAFARAFGRRHESTGAARGRVNLIGEHTDYNAGYVLPTAIPQGTVALAARRDDGIARVASREVGGDAVTFVVGGERPTRTWLDYVQGVVVALAGAGRSPGGFDLYVGSDVPQGSGLSSSAALEISVLRALSSLFDWSLDAVTMAGLGQKAENDFVGAPVGIMDQMACAIGDEGVALFLDTRDLSYARLPLPSEIELAVIDSGVAHNHAAGDYRVRRRECEEAARLLGVPFLRDMEGKDPRLLDALPSPLRERARHVVTENARVLEAREALGGGDLARLGRLFDASHASMRDDFAVSTPEVDTLVELARQESSVRGARLTGGGFGGSIVVVADRGTAAACADRIVERYRRQTGRAGVVHVPYRRARRSD